MGLVFIGDVQGIACAASNGRMTDDVTQPSHDRMNSEALKMGDLESNGPNCSCDYQGGPHLYGEKIFSSDWNAHNSILFLF